MGKVCVVVRRRQHGASGPRNGQTEAATLQYDRDNSTLLALRRRWRTARKDSCPAGGFKSKVAAALRKIPVDGCLGLLTGAMDVARTPPSCRVEYADARLEAAKREEGVRKAHVRRRAAVQ